jgi:hypothetical protein
VPEVNRDEVHTTSADATQPGSSDTVRTCFRHNTIVWGKAVGPPGAHNHTSRRTISTSPPSGRYGAVPPIAPQAADGGGRGFFPQSLGLLQQDHVGGRAGQHRYFSSGNRGGVSGVNHPKSSTTAHRIGPSPNIGKGRNGANHRSASLRRHVPPLARVNLTPAAIGKPQPARPPLTLTRTRRTTTIGVRAGARVVQQIELAV